MSQVTHAMLMSAGLATRMQPFSTLIPKPHLPVMDVPVAVYTMDQLARAGVSSVVANVHALADVARMGWVEIERAFAHAGWPGLVLSGEDSKLLGSGGGVRHALPHLGREPFFLINGDTLCDVDYSALARAHRRGITLLVHRRGPGAYREVFVDSSGKVTALGELQTARPFWTGVAVCDPALFADLPDGEVRDFVSDVLRPAIAAGIVRAVEFEGLWFDVGTPDGWLETHLDWIRRLERGSLPDVWRRRVETRSERQADGLWVKRGARVRSRELPQGPGYFAGDRSPEAFGPNAVVYGAVSSSCMANGIGFDGLWSAVAETR